MLSYEQALNLMLEQVETLGHETSAIAGSLGFVAADNVICNCLVSPFDNSAMDGFALSHADLMSGQNEFEVIGSSFAGDTIGNGATGAWEIMTGAGIPDGYDCVVKIEDITILQADKTGRPQRIKLNDTDIPLGNNIRKAGQDFAPNDVIIYAGETINAAHISALATVGIANINVQKKPTVAVISTGKEIIDDANIELESGQIRNSNGPYLIAILQEMGIEATYIGTIADEIDDYENCLNGLMGRYDIIISTGAVSMGRHDFIPESLERLGAKIIFHKCKIRPGKPILFAKFKQAKSYYFGLPGNPISTSVGLRFFVCNLMNVLQNRALETPIAAKLQQENHKPHSFKMFNKAFAKIESGNLTVNILSGQESFKIKPLLKANCWAVFEENQHKTMAGDLVNIYPMAGRKLEIMDN